MQIIRELSKVIKPIRTNRVNLIDFNLKRSSKLLQLYEGLKSGKFESDKDAIIKLYGSLSERSKYSKLKYDLRKRLFNTIHLVELDVEEVGDARKKYMTCQKAWTTIYFLIFMKSIKAATYVLEKHFPIMMEYDFTSMTLEGAKLLRQHYTITAPNPKEQQKYEQIVKNYLPLYVAETTLEGYFHHLMSYEVQNRSQQEETVALATKYLSEIQKIYPETLSNTFIFRYRMIEIIQQSSQYNYEKTVEICRKAIEELEARPQKYNTAIMIILLQWVNCDIQLANYEQAIENCKKIREHYVTNGDFNWFKTSELYLQVCFHAKRYQEAYAVYAEAINHDRFSRLPNYFIEEWNVFRAYLEFLILTQQLVPKDDLKIPSFRMTKFLNEFSIFSKDKQGINVSIIVAQLIILIAQGKFSKVIDRMEAVEKYASRYLNTEYLYRTRYFIKIISAFYKGGFQKDLIDWNKVAELKDQLAKKPLNIINPNYDVEILRYELLIDLLCDKIKSATK